MRALAQSLSEQHPGDAAAHAVTAIEERAGARGELSPPDRESLRSQLAGISVGQIADAVGGLVDAGGLGNLQTWRDLPAAIGVLEGLPVPDDGVPQLLTFTERLARVVGGVRADGLRRWIETVAAGLGVDEAAVADLRAAGHRP